jgi:c(7)-type cytochrome triheme protein
LYRGNGVKAPIILKGGNEMNSKAIILVVLLLSLALIGTAFALPAGKVKVMETKMGNVTFSSDIHVAKGLNCMDCHKSIFKMKAGELKQPVPHKIGVACGNCHNGERAFSVKKDCTRCHKK